MEIIALFEMKSLNQINVTSIFTDMSIIDIDIG